MALDLLLVRHGQTEWNFIGRVMGRSPVPLNAVGVAQAKNLQAWLKDVEIHAIYSSPVQRAMETAQTIAASRKNLKIIPDEAVSEIDYGDWIGTTFQDLRENHKEAFDHYRFQPSTMKVPGGEAVVDVQRRAVSLVERIRKKHEEGERVVVVSHADVIKAILVHYLGLPLDHLQQVGCDNGSLSIYRFGTEWGDRLVALNYFADVKKILPW